MDLINRYIYAVGQRIPASQREDIEKEIRGLIGDMLDERAPGRDADQKEIEAALKELGNPAELAEKYRGYSRYLIGPDLFEPYMTVLKVVLASIAIFLPIAALIQFVIDPQSVFKQVAGLISSLIMSGGTGFAIVTLIFAAIDYSGKNRTDFVRKRRESWKPADLPPIPDAKRKIKIGDPITGIIFSVFLMLLFIYSEKLAGAFININGHYTMVPVFDSTVVRGLIPLIFALTGVGILKECLKLVERRWTKWLSVANLVINGLSFWLVSLIFADSSLWNPDFMSELVQTGLLAENSEGYQTVRTVWELVTSRLIYVIAIVYLIDTLSVFFKVFLQRPTSIVKKTE